MESNSSPPAGRSDGNGPLSASASMIGRLVIVLVISVGVIGGVYFYSRLSPVKEGTRVQESAPSIAQDDSGNAVSSAPTDSIIGPDDLPGFETEHLSNTQRLWLYHQASLEECSCGCGMNVAQCRIEDPTCPVSPGRAEELVKEAEQRGG